MFIKIFGRPVKVKMATVLICLLWQLPSIVNKKSTGFIFCSCLCLLVQFVNQHTQESLERGPCGSNRVQLIALAENVLGAKFCATWASFKNNENQHPTKTTHYTVTQLSVGLQLCSAQINSRLMSKSISGLTMPTPLLPFPIGKITKYYKLITSS